MSLDKKNKLLAKRNQVNLLKESLAVCKIHPLQIKYNGRFLFFMKTRRSLQVAIKSILCTILFIPFASAADFNLDLLTQEKGKALNCEAGGVATLTPNPNGSGCNISADFTNGGKWIQYWMPINPINAHLIKFVIKAKIQGGDLKIGVRDATKNIVSYAVPSINDTLQTIEVETTKPLQKGDKGIITYPITSVVIFLAKTDSPKLETTIEQITLVTGAAPSQ